MQQLLLAGAARSIPDVHTFVHAVAADGAGNYFIPIIKDGIAGDFAPYWPGEEFHAFSTNSIMEAGKPALIGFAMPGDQFAVGTVWAIGAFLRDLLDDQQRSNFISPRTREAIVRFIAELNATPIAPGANPDESLSIWS